jgi:hypothetical protein
MSIAHKGAVVGAKVMAASVLDLLTSPELLAAAKKQFEQDTKDTKYFSLLPPGVETWTNFKSRVPALGEVGTFTSDKARGILFRV